MIRLEGSRGHYSVSDGDRYLGTVHRIIGGKCKCESKDRGKWSFTAFGEMPSEERFDTRAEAVNALLIESNQNTRFIW